MASSRSGRETGYRGGPGGREPVVSAGPARAGTLASDDSAFWEAILFRSLVSLFAGLVCLYGLPDLIDSTTFFLIDAARLFGLR
ncbi:hypothetical protein [Phaeospirillum tilakii]|uniref:MFS transporter n=1 Tax=Phaeospirillum tilakii TaxID=741673 RepID=A0ABW5CBX9_9PROT